MPQTTRSLKLQGKCYSFTQIPLEFANDRRENVFAEKNNKTVRETIAHRRYKSLAAACLTNYAKHLDSALGQFLLDLKSSGDSFYRKFLNRYGDEAYSTFSISDSSALKARGVYAYYVEDTLTYVGRCKDSMKKRVNQGYGKIHPKNCFLDGQATNCHLNARITASRSPVSLWLHRMDNAEDIEVLERSLLRKYAPPWNIQRT